MRPVDVLDARTEFCAFLRSDHGIKLTDAMTKETDTRLGNPWGTGAARDLEGAPCYWVSAPMTQFVVAAAKTRPDSRYHRTALPSPDGFVGFDIPIEAAHRADGDEQLDPLDRRSWLVRYLGWTTLETFSLLDDERNKALMGGMWEPADDGRTASLTQPDGTVVTGRLCSMYDFVRASLPRLVDGEVDEPAIVRAILMAGHFLDTPVVVVPVARLFVIPDLRDQKGLVEQYPHDVRRLSCTLMPLATTDAAEGELLPTPWQKVMATLWDFVNQHVAEVGEHRDRAAARRAQRSAGKVPDPVRVVTLRRERAVEPPSEATGQSVNWSHRWLVGGDAGGFWRNQWYPSEKVHRLIWIDAYVKGPPDKPLVIKDTVYAVRR